MTELMRLEAEQLAVRSPDVVIVGKTVDPMSEAGLLKSPSFPVWEEQLCLCPTAAYHLRQGREKQKKFYTLEDIHNRTLQDEDHFWGMGTRYAPIRHL